MKKLKITQDEDGRWMARLPLADTDMDGRIVHLGDIVRKPGTDEELTVDEPVAIASGERMKASGEGNDDGK